MKSLINRTGGFTIIEVVLVLAIAGLIFLMIFIALPALQRGQRDTGRRNDVSTVVAAIGSYKANNKNSFANLTSHTQLQSYIEGLTQYEPTNVYIGFITQTNPDAYSSVNMQSYANSIYVFRDKECGTISGTTVNLPTKRRSAAVTALLENNGTTTIPYCQNA